MAIVYKQLARGVSLEIDGGQAMQTWERELMEESADLLTTSAAHMFA